MNNEPVILYDSPEAAHTEMREVWVASTGYASLNERDARYAGSTHRKCNTCGAIYATNYYCHPCLIAKERYDAIEKWARAPKEPINRDELIYSAVLDRYFFEDDSIEEAAEDQGVEYTSEALQLFHCEPQFAWQIDSSIWEDIIPPDDEGDVPNDLRAALDVFNVAVSACKTPISWRPSKVAVQEFAPQGESRVIPGKDGEL